MSDWGREARDSAARQFRPRLLNENPGEIPSPTAHGPRASLHTRGEEVIGSTASPRFVSDYQLVS
jgi:hypothetical protein